MIGLITLALAAAPVAASPLIYLDCTIQQKRGPVEWKVTLNEGEGSVDYDNAISGPQRRSVRFTADAVYFIGFTLSRENLSIERITDDGIQKSHDIGVCRISKQKARAF